MSIFSSAQSIIQCIHQPINSQFTTPSQYPNICADAGLTQYAVNHFSAALPPPHPHISTPPHLHIATSHHVSADFFLLDTKTSQIHNGRAAGVFSDSHNPKSTSLTSWITTLNHAPYAHPTLHDLHTHCPEVRALQSTR